jgi:hypothetical protein
MKNALVKCLEEIKSSAPFFLYSKLLNCKNGN